VTEFRGKLYTQQTLPRLDTAEQAAERLAGKLPLTAERLRELAVSGFAPCAFIGDDPTPYFYTADLVSWVKDNLLRIQDGRMVDPVVVSIERAPVGVVPDVLRGAREGLRLFNGYDPGSVVYFLCLENDVMYVGQSTNLPLRVATHSGTAEKRGRFDRVLYMQVPRSELLQTEAAFIKHLQPPLNVENLRRTPMTDDHKRIVVGVGLGVESVSP
jgi:hypothetical protein